jgi:hypothetical protein
MKNFWLMRRRKRAFAQRINQLSNIIQGAVDKKLKDRLGGNKTWRRKKDTKIRP